MTIRNNVAAVVVVGSNVDRETNLPEAIRRLRRQPDMVVEAVSRVFESPAVGGPPDSPDFFNAAVLVVTALPAEELRQALRTIEAAMGRRRTEDRNAPRPIDLDLVVYGDAVLHADDWQIPDPGLLADAHVAVSVADVIPDWRHPVTGASAYDLVRQLPAAEHVRPVMTISIERPHRARGPEDFDGATQVYAPRLEDLVRRQLVELGEDPEREGLLRTPLRVAKALDYLTSGYAGSLDEAVNGAIFDAEGAEEMVLVKDIEFYSLCEHHMLPFFGRAAVGYLPKGNIIGLSKVARIVDLYARRLQVQERMTNQIADALGEVLAPHGVAVVVEGKHFCMMMRGVQKQDSSMVTSAMRGTFRSDARTRNEFLDLIRR